MKDEVDRIFETAWRDGFLAGFAFCLLLAVAAQMTWGILWKLIRL